MAITAHEIGKDLIAALGLPKFTRAFTLHVRANEFVRVECEYCPDDGKAITTALMEYDLVPRIRRMPAAPAAAPAESVHFDTWYRHRINVAHAKFMERTSYHPSCDWLTFPPDAIERYINGAGV
jgi:hypothetical protein